jgi:HEAT repeat protein
MTTDLAREAHNLFERAMIGLDEDGSGPWENVTGRAAITRLHGLATREVLDAAVTACSDSDAIRRRIGAAVLGQLGHTKIIFVDERLRGLMGLLAAERAGPGDPDVINEACVALGHVRDPRAVPSLVELLGHPDASVRFGIAFGLGFYHTPEAIEGLIALSQDSDDTVRDWATFWHRANDRCRHSRHPRRLARPPGRSLSRRTQ